MGNSLGLVRIVIEIENVSKIQTTINGCKQSDVTASPDVSGYPVGLGELRWLGFGVVARLDGTPQTVSPPRLV